MEDGGPPEGFGAATASLTDKSCVPGQAAFKAAKAENEAILKRYREIMQEYTRQKAAKADMTAAKEVKEELGDRARAGVYGHVPGVAVGDVFAGKGELSVLGLHGKMMSGIDDRKDFTSGAVSISMSGGYKDNEDKGDIFVYTGAGGQDKHNKQVKDQSYTYAQNAALMQNYATGTPVRVFRGRPGKPPVFTYEGLYKVIAHKMENSSDGPKVIRFTMQGVPGHFAVSGKVEFKALRAKAFQKLQLAGGGKEAKKAAEHRKVPKNYQWCFDLPTKTAIMHSIKEREASGVSGVLVSADIAKGLEKVPIPVWNDVDDCRAPFVANNLSHMPLVRPWPGARTRPMFEFQYLQEYVFTDADEADELAEKAHALFAQNCKVKCGIKYHGGECPYNDEGQLMTTQACGLFECPPGCRGAGKGKASLCRRNRVVADGIRYPLEVFRVEGKGWGCRCSVDLPGGAVLCRYIGVVITDETAEDLAVGADTYLYDLNHFHEFEELEEKAGARGKDPDRNDKLPLIPDDLREHHLTVDASRAGNVARFLNHSCDPNCIVVPVFTMSARSQLLHYIAIVAAEDIPKYSELTYDYGSLYIVQGDEEQTAAAEAAGAAAARKRRIPCNCGAHNCRGWLKD